MIKDVSYKTMNWPRINEVDDNGFVYFIVYPLPSYDTSVHGVVVVTTVLIPRLQLLVMTAVFNPIGFGTNKLNVPPISISLSTTYFI